MFQFTCPSRSTTGRDLTTLENAIVSIHVPLAEHDELCPETADALKVSIHVPLAEHDRR